MTGLTMNRGSQSPAKIIRPYFIKQDVAGVPEKSVLDGGEKGGQLERWCKYRFDIAQLTSLYLQYK